MSSIPAESRAAPTVEEVIAVGFSGRGGVCFELNHFMQLLLAALGFDAFLVPGSMFRCPRGGHAITVVRLQKAESQGPDGLYLLDVGCGNPLDVPVPLHELPHRRQAGGCEYEFRALESTDTGTNCLVSDPRSTHARFQIGGSFLRIDNDDDNKTEQKKETVRCDFELARCDFADFGEMMTHIFTDPASELLRVPLLFRYLQHGPDPNLHEWVLIHGMKFLVAGRTKKQLTTYQTYDEILPVVMKHFPTLDEGELRAAFRQFEKVLQEEMALFKF